MLVDSSTVSTNFGLISKFVLEFNGIFSSSNCRISSCSLFPVIFGFIWKLNVFVKVEIKQQC